jgi:hypothetical protein
LGPKENQTNNEFYILEDPIENKMKLIHSTLGKSDIKENEKMKNKKNKNKTKFENDKG